MSFKSHILIKRCQYLMPLNKEGKLCSCWWRQSAWGSISYLRGCECQCSEREPRCNTEKQSSGAVSLPDAQKAGILRECDENASHLSSGMRRGTLCKLEKSEDDEKKKKKTHTGVSVWERERKWKARMWGEKKEKYNKKQVYTIEIQAEKKQKRERGEERDKQQREKMSGRNKRRWHEARARENKTRKVENERERDRG